MTVKEKQHQLYITLGHLSAVAKHGHGYGRWWHRKAQIRIRAKLDRLHSQMRQRKQERRLQSYTGLGPLGCVSCWDNVASCESGGRWSYNGGSGFDGGLQFLPSTWTAYGGGRYAPFAYQASRMQQISIASFMSLSHWPICGSRY